MPNQYQDKYGNTFTNYSESSPVASDVPPDQQPKGIVRPVESPQLAPGVQSMTTPGVYGPDFSGAMQGNQERQKYQLLQAESARAEESLGIKKDYLSIAQEDLGIRKEDLVLRQRKADDEHTEFTWKAQEYKEQKEIQAGMKEAAAQGGYGQVIDYLKVADPARAVQFHAAKLELDQKMMQTETMQAILPNEKLKAQVEAYGIIGKFGAAVMKAPPEEQQQMYDQVKPMMEQAAGPMPDEVEQARSIFLLGAAQSTPEAILFQGVQTVGKYSTQVSKAAAELESRRASNIPDSDEVSQALIAKIKNVEQDNHVQNLQIARAQQQLALGGKDAAEKTVNTIRSDSKNFIASMESLGPVLKVIQVLDKDPLNSIAQNGLRMQMARASGEKGPLNEQDIQRTGSAAGFAKVDKEVVSFLSGNQVQLNAREIKQATVIAKSYFDNAQTVQMQREDEYRKQYASQPDLKKYYDFESLALPSKMYKSIVYPDIQPENVLLKQAGLDNMPPALKAQVQEALAAKKDPAQVIKMAKQMMQQQGAQ